MAQMKIRLPDEMRDSIERTAKARGATMNSEIIRRLELMEGISTVMPERPDLLWLNKWFLHAVVVAEKRAGKRWDTSEETAMETMTEASKALLNLPELVAITRATKGSDLDSVMMQVAAGSLMDRGTKP